jgi:Tfp pilus assembly protein FimV
MNDLTFDLEDIAAKIDFPDKELDELPSSAPASQRLFAHYKNNPLVTAAQTAKAFPEYKSSLVASTTFSLFSRGILKRVDSTEGYKYEVAAQEYPRYTPEARAANIKHARQKKKPALTTKWVETAKPEIVINPPKPTAENILDAMSVRQAYKLYQELHTMFGYKP